MPPSLKAGAPVIGRGVTLSAVVVPKVVRPLVTVAADKPKPGELGPVVTVEALRGCVVVLQRYWVFDIRDLLPYLKRQVAHITVLLNVMRAGMAHTTVLELTLQTKFLVAVQADVHRAE
jgi:hypothetical protein